MASCASNGRNKYGSGVRRPSQHAAITTPRPNTVTHTLKAGDTHVAGGVMRSTAVAIGHGSTAAPGNAPCGSWIFSAHHHGINAAAAVAPHASAGSAGPRLTSAYNACAATKNAPKYNVYGIAMTIAPYPTHSQRRRAPSASCASISSHHDAMHNAVTMTYMRNRRSSLISIGSVAATKAASVAATGPNQRRASAQVATMVSKPNGAVK